MARRRRRLLDVLETYFSEYTRDELYRFLMCREIVQINSGGTTVLQDPHAPVTTEGTYRILTRQFVSRGGEKLRAALEEWEITPENRTWLDAGASTGGFTDCLLQGGATGVIAVDVGFNQLDYRLRRDPRVLVRERTNVRAVISEYSAAGDSGLPPGPGPSGPAIDAVVCDLSFRSLRGVLADLLRITREGWGIALLKPQFETAAAIRWGEQRESPSLLTGGVVEDAKRGDRIDRTIQELSREGVHVLRRLESPITGRRGNREELLLVGLFSAVSAVSDQANW